MKIEIISNMINQSCDIFHYSPKPDQLKNILKAFIEVLQDYRADFIQHAFQKYLREGTAFPAPAHIVDIIEGKNDPVRVNYGPVTTTSAEERAEIDARLKATSVPWALKPYSEINQSERAELCNHLRAMEKEKRENYKLYLVQWCGFPKSFFSRISDINDQSEL